MRKVFDDGEFDEKLTDLLLSRGVRALTVGAIATHMRCSKRRLYELAQTKEDLFFRVIQRHFDKAIEEGRAVKDAARGDMATVLTDYLKVGAKAGQKISIVCLEDIEQLPEAKIIFDNYQNSRGVILTDVIEQGITLGVFVPCHTQLVIETIRASAQKLRQPDFLTSANLTMDQAFDEFYRIFLGGLLARPVERVK